MVTLEVRNATVRYKKRIGIKNASLEAKRGQIIGFIGADGTGKSSLMHAIAGVGPFEGEIRFEGIAYHSPKEAEPIKQKFGLMPQGIGLVLYKNLTVAEHLDFFAAIRNIRKDAAFRSYRKRLLHMAGLERFTDRQAGKLSGGMMQKLSLICTLLHRPKLLILDEPTTGVDPLSRLELWEILDDIRKAEGTVALVSTAYMQEAARMDRIYLFDDGEIIADGTAEELLDTVHPMTYEPVPCPEDEHVRCIHTGHFTYALTPIDAPPKEPTLEALFFVNALKKGRRLPVIEVSPKESEVKIPPVVMEAKGLTKRFGDFVADDHIDMQLKSREILGLLGANGAGKTTFIKMLLGLYPIDEGELTLLGRPIRSARDRQSLKAKIGYVSQHFALYKDMTVRENLLYFANMHKIPASRALPRILRYAGELGFESYMDALPTELPLGINQRFSVAAALLHEPVILFLDEPTSGVDAIARNQFWQMLQLIKERWGIAILITTHYMSEAEYCDRIVLLKQGKKIADDTVENLYKTYPDAKNFEEIFLQFYREEAQ
ncbi:ATP-binding cassette domain-containing protein [Hydrogenimonas urashimensis]|uniref:ATP-binding cassette domain-containing protein n=1 Tax=Hydrogenimonas urashimensis TaxID=2740515 RepID=UPI00191643D0|nr:ATP-binding cassette domain-containing protein [Hydrogenimonas urashimensis]